MAFLSGADGGTRTRDLFLTKEVLYLLSYISVSMILTVCGDLSLPAFYPLMALPRYKQGVETLVFGIMQDKPLYAFELCRTGIIRTGLGAILFGAFAQPKLANMYTIRACRFLAEQGSRRS